MNCASVRSQNSVLAYLGKKAATWLPFLLDANLISLQISSGGPYLEGEILIFVEAVIVHSTTRASTLSSCTAEKPLKAELCKNNLLKCASRSSIVRPKHSDDMAVYAPEFGRSIQTTWRFVRPSSGEAFRFMRPSLPGDWL
jgi:hypothetical protein